MQKKLNFESRLLLLGFFFGACVGLLRAKSYAFFLFHMDAGWSVVVALISEIVLLTVLQNNSQKSLSLRYSLIGIVFSIFGCVSYFSHSVEFQAVAFLLFTLILRNFTKSVLFELSIVYLPKSQAQHFSFSSSAAQDFGSLAIVLLSLFWSSNLTENFIFATFACTLVLFCFLAYNSRKSKLITFENNNELSLVLDEPEVSSKNRVLVFYSMMTFIAGLFYALQEIAWRWNLQELSTDKNQIQLISSLYVILSNMLGAFLSTAIYYKNKRFRVSPFVFIWIFWITSFVAAIGFWLLGNVWSSLILGVSSSVAFRNLFISGNNNLISCFDNSFRNDFRKIHQVTMYIAPLIPVAFIVFGTGQFDKGVFISRSAYSLITLAIVGVAVSFYYRDYLTKLMLVYLQSFDKSRRVSAALLAGLIKPKGYSAWLEEVVKSNPKTLLTKTVIESLSFDPNKRNAQIIMTYFKNPKEEIQIAVCQAMARMNLPQSYHFLLDVLTSPNVPLRVRQTAFEIAFEQYSNQILGSLIYILESASDDAIKMAVLESVSQAKNTSLNSIFIENLSKSDPSTLGFSLIGLYNSSMDSELFDQQVERYLKDPNHVMYGIVCFVLSKLKLNKWAKKIERDNPRNRMGRLGQLWYLYRMNGTIRLRQLTFLRNCLHDPICRVDLLELLASLSNEDRLATLTVLIEHSSIFKLAVPDLLEILKKSNLDFHLEILYLKIHYNLNIKKTA